MEAILAIVRTVPKWQDAKGVFVCPHWLDSQALVEGEREKLEHIRATWVPTTGSIRGSSGERHFG